MTKKNAFKNRIGNAGSALVSVVVAMVFVVALGTALLFSAYMGFMVKSAERKDNASFYTAETAMNEIRAGVQNMASEALADAYTQVITGYMSSHEEGYTPQGAFKSEFKKRLLSVKNANSTPLFNSYDNIIFHYDPEALRFYLNPPEDVSLDLYRGDGAVLIDEEKGTVTLRGISVTLVAEGYESHISTDITINTPEFYASSVVPSDMASYAIVADTALGVSGIQRKIVGDVFVGNDGISVANGGDELSFSGGNLFCKGDILVNNGGKLVFNNSDGELWTKGISIGGKTTRGSVDLNGKIYVADDLTIDGNKTDVIADYYSAAKLTGSYFGFGAGDTADTSSAIIVNGKGVELNMAGLNKLSLAGVSFIDVVGKNNGQNVNTSLSMGESLSIKSNQLIYLVPPEAIKNYSSNPCVRTDGSAEPETDMEYILWDEKPISYYAGNDGLKNITVNLSGGMGQKITYVYMSFASRDKANEYFRDYFANNGTSITQYVSEYVSFTGKGDQIRTNGNSFYMEDGEMKLVPGNSAGWSQITSKRFNETISPFSAVNTAAINAYVSEGGLTFYKEAPSDNPDNPELVPVAKVYNGNAVITADDTDLIVATGDVTVNSDYTGIIIAGGTVSVKADVSAPPGGLDQSIFSATTREGMALSEFIGTGITSGSVGGKYNGWDPDKLVVYSNWNKN